MSDKTRTILIVDDDEVVIEQLSTHFRRIQYETIATSDPTIVDQTLDTFNVQLLLLDLRMERLNGYEVLKKIREKGHQTPVLIITAYFQDEQSRLAEMGVTEVDVIEKPFRDFKWIEEKIASKLEGGAPPSLENDYDDELYYENDTRIMIVDDEEEITEILAETLRERQYEVETFLDGKAALDYVQAGKPACQIGIIDMVLPELMGHDLIAEILKVQPEMKFIPISAEYADEMKEKLEAVGYPSSKLISKPFDLPMLIEQIKLMAMDSKTLGPS